MKRNCVFLKERKRCKRQKDVNDKKLRLFLKKGGVTSFLHHIIENCVIQGITIKAKLSEGVVHKQPLKGFPSKLVLYK